MFNIRNSIKDSISFNELYFVTSNINIINSDSYNKESLLFSIIVLSSKFDKYTFKCNDLLSCNGISIFFVSFDIFKVFSLLSSFISSICSSFFCILLKCSLLYFSSSCNKVFFPTSEIPIILTFLYL